MRTARGALLVALVIAVVMSANFLMASSRGAPGAAEPPDATTAEVGDLPTDEGASMGDDTGIVADTATADEPTDLSPDLADATEPAPRAADSEPILDPTEQVQLAAPIAPAASGQASDTAAPGKFKRTVVANLAYGTGAANVGISTGSGQRPAGPASFAVDAAGTIYVSDNVNGRVQVYSSKGSYLRSLDVDASVFDLTAGDANDLYVLGADGSLFIQDSTTGKVKAKGAAAGAAADELGKLRVANGQLTLESPRQVSTTLAASRNGAMALLSSKEQSSGQRKGAATGSQNRYTTSFRDGGHVYRLDQKGNTVQDIALRLSDIASIVFLQEDRSGSIYVQVERASGNGQVSVEVRQLSAKGELTAVVPIDRVDYVPMTRSTIVADDGTIYQLVPTAQGVAFVKYQRP